MEPDTDPPEARPGWRERTRRLRLAVLIAALLVAGAVLLAKRAGYLAYLDPPPFTGHLAHGVEVEQVDLVRPAARVVVARVPRDRGLGLSAVLLSPARQDLRTLGPVAAERDALLAINGDYHRLSGSCFATPFSTLVDAGRVRVLGSPFGYAAAFWLDTCGRPHISRLDLRGEATLPSGATLELFVNLEQGDCLLIDRPPGGRWSSAGYVGVPVTGSFAAGAVTVGGPPAEAWQGAALLARTGGPAEAAVRGLKPGDRIALRLRGADAGRVRLAIGTGPRLLEDGRIHPDAERDLQGWVRRLGRTAVGFNDRELILVTTLQTPHAGLSMPALAEVMRRLGCREAINLDGGPSSTLWADGRALNVPAADGDVAVASGLLVHPPGQGVPLR